MDDGHHQGHLLLHAGGEVGHLHLRKLVDAEAGEELLPPPVPHGGVHLVETGEKVEEVVGGKAVLQLQLAGEKADASPDLVRLPDHAGPVHHRIPAVGADEGGQQPQGRGFPRAVGAQKAENLALVGGEAEMIHRRADLLSRFFQLLLLGGQPEGLGQTLHLQ